eukprot:TRINITY_DN30844_c1_g1_i2.p3 TRINITY_DN30844_c1_g1~~TRINITY_DN30844_c1_g1_i2.p3  ORF type:complete len:141 (-),score=19.37 TRINITY_DN30844_c1_g1_i2:90-512(-)
MKGVYLLFFLLAIFCGASLGSTAEVCAGATPTTQKPSDSDPTGSWTTVNPTTCWKQAEFALGQIDSLYYKGEFELSPDPSGELELECIYYCEVQVVSGKNYYMVFSADDSKGREYDFQAEVYQSPNGNDSLDREETEQIN